MQAADVPAAPDTMRLYFLDSVRTLCMLLIIPYHAAHIYETQKDWWVHSAQNSWLFDLIITLQRSFCMSAFFIVAGFFSAHVIDNRGLRDWGRGRISRLLVPLVVSLLTVQVWQMVIAANLEGNGDFWSYWSAYLADRGRINIFHLWFIPCLIFQSLALGLIVARFGTKPFVWKGAYRHSILLLVAANLLLFILARNLPKLLKSDLFLMWGLIDLQKNIFYLVPFLLGAKLFWDRAFRDRFLQLNTWSMGFALLTYVLVTIFQHSDGFPGKPIRDISLPIAAICISQTLIAFAYKYLRGPNVLTRHLSEPSYSLYLLHHPIVMVAGIAFLSINMNIFAEYGIIVAAGFLIPYLVHRYFIAPWPVMSFLFNGKPLSKREGRAGRALT